MADIFSTLISLLTVSPKISKWLDLGLPVVAELQKSDPNLIPVLGDIGKKLFPKLQSQISTVTAAAESLFHPQGVTWVQNALNRIDNAGLVVDGVAGANTKKAVEKFQAAHQPDAGPVDGWAGAKTKAALAAALAKLAPDGG